MLNTADEKMSILKMIEDKKIDASQGVQLLEALGKSGKTPQQKPVDPGSKPRFMRILVTNANTGKSKVNVTLPYTLVSWGLRLGAQYAPELASMDLDALDDALEGTAGTKIIDVMDDEDGEHVEIYID